MEASDGDTDPVVLEEDGDEEQSADHVDGGGLVQVIMINCGICIVTNYSQDFSSQSSQMNDEIWKPFI